MNTIFARSAYRVIWRRIAAAVLVASLWSGFGLSAPIVTLGTLSNNFSNSSQLDTPLTAPTQTVKYAIGVANVLPDLALGGITFQHDSTGGQDIDPNIVPGYTTSNAKRYSGNSPTMSETNLNTLLRDNRYGNNNQVMDVSLAVTPGTGYELELLIWENYLTGSNGRVEGLTINGAPAFANLDTIADLAGPLSSNAFLYKYSFVSASSSLNLHFFSASPVLNGLVLLVPEPSTLAFLAGASLLALRRRRAA